MDASHCPSPPADESSKSETHSHIWESVLQYLVILVRFCRPSQALRAQPRLSAHISRPAAAPANYSPLGSTQAPRRRRARLARCRPALRSAVAIDPASDVPAHLEGVAVTKLGPLAPRSDEPRTTRLRTPRRDPARGGRQHLQPATLTMVDAQPACTADHHFLAARHAPQPTRCATPSTALRPKPRKTGLRLPWAWRSRGCRQRTRSCAGGAREESVSCPLYN